MSAYAFPMVLVVCAIAMVVYGVITSDGNANSKFNALKNHTNEDFSSSTSDDELNVSSIDSSCNSYLGDDFGSSNLSGH